MTIFEQWVRFPKAIQYLLWFNLIAVILLLIYLNDRFTPHTSILFKFLHYGMVGFIGFALLQWSNATKAYQPVRSVIPIYLCNAVVILILLSGVYVIKNHGSQTQLKTTPRSSVTPSFTAQLEQFQKDLTEPVVIQPNTAVTHQDEIPNTTISEAEMKDVEVAAKQAALDAEQ